MPSHHHSARRYEAYCRCSDFIREHIFPGGHLPCIGAMVEAARGTGLSLEVRTRAGMDAASVGTASRAANYTALVVCIGGLHWWFAIVEAERGTGLSGSHWMSGSGGRCVLSPCWAGDLMPFDAILHQGCRLRCSRCRALTRAEETVEC